MAFINKAKKFYPNLSPHSLRLIRKMFVEYQNSQEELIKELENQVTLFDKIHITEHPSHFMKFNKENISYNTCCSLLADLIAAGWKVSLGIEGFQISKPEYNKTFKGASLDEVKDKMRKIQLVNRDKQVKSIEVQRFIARMERPQSIGNEKKSILNLIDSGKELSEIFKDIAALDEEKKVSLLKKIIQPEIVICFPDDPLFKEEEHHCPYTGLRLSDIWKYFRLTWSSELKSVPGKSFPLLIRNAARANKPIIGIAMLRSAALADEAREDTIGWTSEEIIRRKIYAKEINVDFVVKQMLRCLDEQINLIRRDDFEFLNSQLIKFPNDEIIKKLFKIYDEEYEKRKDELKDEKKQAPRISDPERADWVQESEKALFRKKRASKLARFLEVRKSFNDVNIGKNPAKGYATLIHRSNKRGDDMISRVLREIRIKALAENIMDVSVCGSIAPYNEILGGKLIAALMGSQEVRELFRSRYHAKKYRSAAIIASSNKGEPVYRDANLMCLTTTSLYGVASSQYNKLKFLKKDFPELENDIIWQEVFKNDISHKTKGQGVYHFSDKTSKLLNILTTKKLRFVQVNHKFGEGTSPKLRKLQLGIRCLINQEKSNMPSDDFFAHAIQRKNYVLFYEKPILEKLLNQSKSFSSTKASKATNISSAWIKRWLVKRISREETLKKLQDLGPDSVHKQLYFQAEDKSPNLFNLKKKIGA